MQIKVMMRYNLTPMRISYIKICNQPLIRRCNEKEHQFIISGMSFSSIFIENRKNINQKVENPHLQQFLNSASIPITK